MSIEWVNTASVIDLEHFFRRCCASERWVQRMVTGKPYDSREEVLKAAVVNWQELDEVDYLQAFEGHPKIGDLDSLQKPYLDSKRLASSEQAKVNTANQETLKALAELNEEYQAKFGFIFIVCAMDKNAEEILILLKARLENTRVEELHHASFEQSKITRMRLEKLL